MTEPARIVPFAAQQEVGPDDVVRLWTGEGALSLETAQRRVGQVLLVALAGGAPVGVCTAYVRVDDQLRMPLWHFRAFVARSHRGGDIGLRLLIGGRDHLRERYEAGIDRRAAGILLQVQNPGIMRRFDEGRWPRTDFTFVGSDARGAHRRVHFFRGATVPVEPAG
jgi:hypothetical protein